MHHFLHSIFHNSSEVQHECFELTHAMPNYAPTAVACQLARDRLEKFLSEEAKEAFQDYCEAKNAMACAENDAAFLTGVNFCATLATEALIL